MLKLIPLIISIVLFLLIPSQVFAQNLTQKALFVWTLEDEPVLSSKLKIQALINFAQSNNIKILFVQVYRSNKTWFPSKTADQTPYLEIFKKVDQDPFALLIRKAHAAGIEVHAWLNMLSLAGNKDAVILKKYGPSVLTVNTQKKKKLEDYKIDNQFFLEPGDKRVRKELLDILDELLRAYPDLDGIQFDYIRYPDVHPFYGYSPSNIKEFKRLTHLKKFTEDSPQWKQFKRDQVTGLVQELVTKARSMRPSIHISTTGCLAYSRAYYEALQDWPSWVNRGLIEFVTVMNYPPDVETYQKNIVEIKPKVEDFGKVNVAVGSYKPEQTVEMFKGQLDYCLSSGAKACAIFNYDDLLRRPDFLQSIQKR